MKKHLSTILLTLLCWCYAVSLIAQESLPNDASNPCVTDAEYQLLEARCAANVQALKLPTPSQRVASTSLGWPLRPSANLHDCSYYHIAAYVDHNTTASAIQDYNCGTITYDGHRGTDIATWPFNFYKMDNSLVEVVAAAAGTIIDKHDGEFDRNCSSNSLTANYIIIGHADGSYALYWHMKKNSVTSKAIGQTVAAGEYLGVVGASGSASGPHLHFEVWAGNTVATRIDPYYASCNKLNASSWWTAQKPYRETSIVKVSTNTTDIVYPACPTTETPNETNTFDIPFQGPGLTAGYAKFYIFIRDEVNGLTADVSIINPDASTFASWTYTSSSAIKVRYWGWSKKLPTVPGKYTFKATYNGTTCSTDFTITSAITGTNTNNSVSGIQLFPNPNKGTMTVIVADYEKPQQLYVYNLLGELVLSTAIEGGSKEIQHQLHSGIYYYQIRKDDQIIYSNKLMVE